MLEVFDILEIFGRILNTLLRLTLHKLEVNVAIFFRTALYRTCHRGEFRAQSSLHEQAFCVKRSILDIRLGSKYTSASYINFYFHVKFQLIKYCQKIIYVQIE